MDGSGMYLIALLSGCLISLGSGENQLARGWNANIDWVSLEDGQKLSKEQNKPMMLVIHKSWCGACKALMPKFAESKEIEELSKSFVMVNVVDDEEPTDSKFSPDGGYIPRILFLDSLGNVMTDIINEDGNDKYKYYYPSTAEIAKSMNKCLEKSARQSGGADEL